METQSIPVVAVSQEEVGAEIGISGDAVGVLLARATDAACIDATMNAHYSGDAPMDDITIDGLAGVLDKFRHVITQYRLALLSSREKADGLRGINESMFAEKGEMLQQKNALEQRCESMQAQLDRLAQPPADDGTSSVEVLSMLKKERDDLAEQVKVLEATVAGPKEPIPPMHSAAKVQLRLQKYRLLVQAVGHKLTEMPPSVKAAYGAAIAK
jgi:hypothetical protein